MFSSIKHLKWITIALLVIAGILTLNFIMKYLFVIIALVIAYFVYTWFFKSNPKK